MKKITTIAALALILCGCTSEGYYEHRGQSLAPSTYRFSDLPVPAQFIFMPLDSFVYESGQIRVGMLEYRGQAWPQEISDFYKKRLPEKGWQIFNTIESKETSLAARKGGEILLIRFQSQGNKGTLTISLSPVQDNKNPPAK